MEMIAFSKRAMRGIAGLVGIVAVSGCGGLPADEIESRHSELLWDPGSALHDEHMNWHQGACGTPGARICPHSGEEFLVFHRNYIDRLRDAYESQGLSADVTRWDRVPAAIKQTAYGWNASLQDAENRIWSMIDPTTGQKFASLEAYGSYIENNYYIFLPAIAAAAYNDVAIGSEASAPTSSYFLKIHGMVDMHFQRFQKGDFNKDGYSDIVDRNTSTGENKIWAMNGISVASVNPIEPVDTGACHWYVGASADLNYDGNLDLVWHGPGCNATVVWLMNGYTHVGDVWLPGVDGSWRLIGAGDFNQDSRPDLAWVGQGVISFWRMNGTDYLGSVNVTPPSGYQASAVADVDDGGIPDIILLSSPSYFTWAYSVLYMGANFWTGSVFPLQNTGGTSGYTSFSGVGRFQAKGKAADLLFRTNPPAPNGYYSFALWTSIAMGTPNYTATTSYTVAPTESFAGTR